MSWETNLMTALGRDLMEAAKLLKQAREKPTGFFASSEQSAVSRPAERKTQNAFKLSNQDPPDHGQAMDAHSDAANAHSDAASVFRQTGNSNLADYHGNMAQAHRIRAAHHKLQTK